MLASSAAPSIVEDPTLPSVDTLSNPNMIGQLLSGISVDSKMKTLARVSEGVLGEVETMDQKNFHMVLLHKLLKSGSLALYGDVAIDTGFYDIESEGQHPHIEAYKRLRSIDDGGVQVLGLEDNEISGPMVLSTRYGWKLSPGVTEAQVLAEFGIEKERVEVFGGLGEYLRIVHLAWMSTKRRPQEQKETRQVMQVILSRFGSMTEFVEHTITKCYLPFVVEPELEHRYYQTKYALKYMKYVPKYEPRVVAAKLSEYVNWPDSFTGNNRARFFKLLARLMQFGAVDDISNSEKVWIREVLSEDPRYISFLNVSGAPRTVFSSEQQDVMPDVQLRSAAVNIFAELRYFFDIYYEKYHNSQLDSGTNHLEMIRATYMKYRRFRSGGGSLPDELVDIDFEADGKLRIPVCVGGRYIEFIEISLGSFQKIDTVEPGDLVAHLYQLLDGIKKRSSESSQIGFHNFVDFSAASSRRGGREYARYLTNNGKALEAYQRSLFTVTLLDDRVTNPADVISEVRNGGQVPIVNGKVFTAEGVEVDVNNHALSDGNTASHKDTQIHQLTPRDLKITNKTIEIGTSVKAPELEDLPKELSFFAQADRVSEPFQYTTMHCDGLVEAQAVTEGGEAKRMSEKFTIFIGEMVRDLGEEEFKKQYPALYEYGPKPTLVVNLALALAFQEITPSIFSMAAQDNHPHGRVSLIPLMGEGNEWIE